MNLSEMARSHVDAVNARNVAKGICLVHPGGEAPPPSAYVLTLPNGNAVPVCKDCHKWWMSNLDYPESVPVSVTAVTR